MTFFPVNLKFGTTTALVSLIAILSVTPASSAPSCFLPNGTISKNDLPCFPQNPESSCCGGSDYVCSTNNMCQYIKGPADQQYFVIGSCTDESWNSPACPGYCYFRTPGQSRITGVKGLTDPQ